MRRVLDLCGSEAHFTRDASSVTPLCKSMGAELAKRRSSYWLSWYEMQPLLAEFVKRCSPYWLS